MSMNQENLIWIDLEMTGLDSFNDVIIEIATVVTDKDLNLLGEGPVIAIHQPAEALAKMDDWNQKQHGGSGLVKRVQDSEWTEAQAEQATLEFPETIRARRVRRRCAAIAFVRIGVFLPDKCRNWRSFSITAIWM